MVKDINDLYFTDEECDIFAEKYQCQRTKYLEDIRAQIQEKLLDLNKYTSKEIDKRGLQLYNHPNPSNITSLKFPCWYNKGKVTWIGVRYGKHPKDIKDLNNLYGNRCDGDPKYSFQKHSCLQVNVGYNGVDVGIFHAVPYGAVDRWYLHEHIRNNDTKLLDAIMNEIESIKGYGYVWNIWDTNLEGVELPNFGGPADPASTYYFDNENEEDFLTWYSKHDKDGCYSSMLVHFPRYSEKITKDNIVDTVMEIFEQLYPLYKLLSWNIHYTGEVVI